MNSLLMIMTGKHQALALLIGGCALRTYTIVMRPAKFIPMAECARASSLTTTVHVPLLT